MMDVSEAIKGLDNYAEALLSLNTLLGANLFEEKSDQHQALLTQTKEKQADARAILLQIINEIHNVGIEADRSGDLTGISAAMQRYVAADNQANETLMKAEKATKPNEVSEALRRFREEIGWQSGDEPV
jgi:hypothetical protein